MCVRFWEGGIVLVLVLAIALSFGVGFLRGGTFSNLTRTRLRFIPFVFLAVFVQLLIFSTILGREPIVHRIGPYIHIATLVVSLGVMLLNRRVPGMKLIAAGAALNLLVIAANGGFMPISESALQTAGLEEMLVDNQPRNGSEDYVLPNSKVMDGDANLLFLGDVIPIPEEAPISTIVSIGDVILAFGACVVVVSGMRTRNPRGEDEATLVLQESTR